MGLRAILFSLFFYSIFSFFSPFLCILFSIFEFLVPTALNVVVNLGLTNFVLYFFNNILLVLYFSSQDIFLIISNCFSIFIYSH